MLYYGLTKNDLKIARRRMAEGSWSFDFAMIWLKTEYLITKKTHSNYCGCSK